jgi:hypothetical protein
LKEILEKIDFKDLPFYLVFASSKDFVHLIEELGLEEIMNPKEIESYFKNSEIERIVLLLMTFDSKELQLFS